MQLMRLADNFAQAAAKLATTKDLEVLLDAAAREMGFRYFAIMHHTNGSHGMPPAIRLHNYPDGWAEWFDSKRLGSNDPVHRASRRSSLGFAWSRLPDLIPLTARDLEILQMARQSGLGDGFTVPAHIPGEAAGSCSFVTKQGGLMSNRLHGAAQLIGAFAFEGARRLVREAHPWPATPGLSDRQRDCLYWVARGKSDWEVSRILGLSHGTVIQYLKQARHRYGVITRAQLTVHALFDGSLSFSDLLRD